MVGPHFKHKRLDKHALMLIIEQYIANYGYSPTIRELANFTDNGVSTVYQHLNELICGGYIKVEQTRRRILRVVKGYD